MQKETWDKVKEMLQEVLNIEASKRQEFLDKSGISPEVRAEVQSLLEYETEAENLMDLSAVEFSKYFFDDDEESPNALIGQNIGVYQIVRELGYGGMGAVYLAERADGKFEQKVALKLLKREMNTSELRRRFEQERKILASLEHPNIARLLDAGTTDDKIPFLAMEYVEGLPITDYCETHNLGLAGRLDLFRTVCGTVNFAHRNLIVHRDLKPSNIFITKDGVPKLLDFGISKILSAEFKNPTAATITKLGAMTPSYASPEQLQSKSATTATDIYSLGVILYELLSGHRPFETKESDLKEIYKAVLETDPPPPSAMLGTVSKSFKKESEAKTERKAESLFDSETQFSKSESDTLPNKFQQTAPRTVSINSQSLRGDLDNIVLKALRKEPERRYSSAENFAEDIKRYLRGLPVTARPNTFSYRTEKFVKRNRATIFAGVLILLAIIGGIIATLWQARVAQAERAKAEKRFNDVRTLANSFLFEFSPKIENLPGSMPARQLLVTRALEYLDNLSQEAGGDLQLQSELAKAYEKVGDVQGNPDTPNVGDLKGALESYEKALAIRRKLLEAAPENPAAKSDLANNLEISANIHLNGGEFDKAEGLLAEAVALREKVVQEKSQDLAARSSLAKALRLSGFVPFYNGDNEKAIEYYNRSIEIFGKLNEEYPNDSYVGYQYANLYLDIGESYAWMDKMNPAAENLQKGLDMLIALREKYPNDNRVRRSVFIAYLKRAENHRDTEDFANSLIKYDKALEIAQEALKIDPTSFQAKRDLVIANKQRAVTLRRVDKYKESVEGFARAIEVSEQLKKDDPNNTLIIYDIAGSYQEMGETYYFSGDYQSAITAAQKAIDNCNEVLAKSSEHTQSVKVTAKAKYFIGNNYLALAEKNNQSELWRKALENYRASLDVYNKLKAEGKLTETDQKVVDDLEKELGKIKNKVGNS